MVFLESTHAADATLEGPTLAHLLELCQAMADMQLGQNFQKPSERNQGIQGECWRSSASASLGIELLFQQGDPCVESLAHYIHLPYWEMDTPDIASMHGVCAAFVAGVAVWNMFPT